MWQDSLGRPRGRAAETIAGIASDCCGAGAPACGQSAGLTAKDFDSIRIFMILHAAFAVNCSQTAVNLGSSAATAPV